MSAEAIDFLSLLEHNAKESKAEYWLRDRQGDEFTTWSFAEALDEIKAVGAWLEQTYGNDGSSIGLLSKNRAHWMMADMATIISGNVTIPYFTTMAADMVDYIRDLMELKVLFVGEALNWETVQGVFPEDVTIITLPGVDPGRPHLKWEEILNDFRGQAPEHQADPEAVATIAFTSGTTGKPKGVMNSQKSMIVPSRRAASLMDTSRMFSYLPLAHIAERYVVEVVSIVNGTAVTFNESMEHLVRDFVECRPTYLFGPPRVWEQLQQGILAKFGGQEGLDAAIEQGGEAVKQQIREGLGLDECKYLLSAAAPIAPPLIRWYHSLGLMVVEGFGQSEVMGAILSTDKHFKVGSIGTPCEGVECMITDEGELAIRADGIALGYYQRPEETAETFRDGWVYTGDKVRVDEDGFYYIIGRVKDTFKTIHGKFVSPAPIEGQFAKAEACEQVCLLGRGYNKPVMVCVLAESAAEQTPEVIEAELRAVANAVNETVEKHARIGAIMVSKEAWTIDNEVLTHTLKIRREQVEGRFGERAQQLALQAAETKELLLEWA